MVNHAIQVESRTPPPSPNVPSHPLPRPEHLQSLFHRETPSRAGADRRPLSQPVYIRDGLAPALLRENIPATFIEDVTALNADSLRDHQLLIILRDGMNWPDGYDKPPVKWMTDAQQQAIWDFVNNGGGFPRAA